MNATPTFAAPVRMSGPVLVHSTGHRDALASAVGALGWEVVACRRSAGLAQRLNASGAQIAVIDARDGEDQAVRAVEALSKSKISIALIYDEEQAQCLERALELGVTHLLRAPFAREELAAILTLAGRILPVAREGGLHPLLRDHLSGFSLISELRSWLGREMTLGPVSLLLVNIARFDAINASMGREVGDAALRALAHRIAPLVSEVGHSPSIVARMPGAEFAIAFGGDIEAERLHLLAELIVDAVSKPFGTEGGTVRLGARVAIVEGGPGLKGPAHLIRQATGALGEIRDSESGSIRTLLGEAGRRDSATKSLHADLRTALSQNEIDVLFQPQVGVNSGVIEGVEALARWRHPVRGEIGATTLFAVAEQSNYLVELSSHIQKRALTLAAAWPEPLSHLRLSINVTAVDIARPRFARNLQALIDESGFPHRRLTLEVTESSVMEHLDAAAKILAHFRAIGCRVAIDDFGTGYSSLAWLKSLPADYLKLDKSMADEVMGGDRDTVVLRAVVSMARSLGLTVIAEGVETEAQLALLTREGCSLYQGFLCAPALGSEALARLVEQRG
jgi:EAL domain-containing protein (putative c-di-GMP-specific phosphodiesterase class I)/GGDEF domain-containing protein